MTSVQPPTFSSVSELLAGTATPAALAASEDRYRRVHARFVERFGREPDFFARSPGRVNIIGEHIDYCGYSVMPMAIARDVIIAVAAVPDSDKPVVTMSNINPEKYPDNTFTHDPADVVEIDSSILAWSNYFKCGYKGAFQVLKEDNVEGAAAGRALDILVDGNVPAGAGVSSSSAFVCAAALATLAAYGHAAIDKTRLTETAIRGEHFAGVQTGGMDQSISVMGTPDSALLIHFFPRLRAEPMRFPASAAEPFVFVIANTLVTADKHTTAPTNYNLRVVETRLAAALLAARFLPAEHRFRAGGVPARITLRDFQEEWLAHGGAAHAGEPEAAVLKRLEELAAEALHEEPYSKAEVAAELGVSEAQLDETFIGSIVVRFDGLRLHQRVRHVFSEARRVFEFRDVCALKPPYTGELLKDLGALMNASQKSCKELFNCSCPELDELTSICLASGALGSRLTGAGWGGCTVSLVPEAKLASFVERVTAEYYLKRDPSLAERTDRDALLADWIFASKPSAGAAVLRGLTF